MAPSDPASSVRVRLKLIFKSQRPLQIFSACHFFTSEPLMKDTLKEIRVFAEETLEEAIMSTDASREGKR